MTRMRNGRFFATTAAGYLLLAGWAGSEAALGDDLVTLSGTTYHDVQPVRVEPDGVTWQYAEGVCKVDFADCPERVRTTYHYDAAKAASYHDAQVRQRQQADEETRQVLQQVEEHRRATAQAALADVVTHSATGRELAIRRAASPAASEATRALGAQMAAAAAKQAVQPTGVFGALAHSSAGTVLSILGVKFYQGPSVLNEGPAVPNQNEAKADLHHAPGPVAPDAAHDPFYTPIYMTKSYDEDVDRSAAFLRDVPLKP